VKATAEKQQRTLVPFNLTNSYQLLCSTIQESCALIAIEIPSLKAEGEKQQYTLKP